MSHLLRGGEPHDCIVDLIFNQPREVMSRVGDAAWWEKVEARFGMRLRSRGVSRRMRWVVCGEAKWVEVFSF